jgi:hypothetical protein
MVNHGNIDLFRSVTIRPQTLEVVAADVNNGNDRVTTKVALHPFIVTNDAVALTPSQCEISPSAIHSTDPERQFASKRPERYCKLAAEQWMRFCSDVNCDSCDI